MKKTITKISLVLGLLTSITSKSQSVITFDNFSLAPDTFYQNASSNDFSENEVTFRYDWSSFGYWSGGTAYTNKKDTIFTASSTPPYYTNLYSCIPGVAFTGTNYATAQNGAIITFSNNTTAVSGFYITNTTYAWKSIKNGDQFARKFGDTTGTGSGNTIAQGEYPDWFKIVVRGFRAGNMLTDSVEFYLADYRANGTANDYVIKNWQFVNCVSLGQVDSIRIDMKSSDVGSFGINTPTFFSMDNFTTQSTVGVEELASVTNISVFPNPAKDVITLSFQNYDSKNLTVSIFDINGREVNKETIQPELGVNQIKFSTLNLSSGIYIIDINSTKKIKFIKY